MRPYPPMSPFDAPVHPVDARAVRRRYRRGETLMHAGDAGDVLRIEQGLVKLVVPAFDGRDRILAVLGSGDLLGAEAALGHRALVADAVALNAVTVVASDRATFLAELRNDPERALAVAQGVVRRLGAAWDDQARAYRPVQERLAAAMVDLTHRFGEPGRDGWSVLSCGLNHHALAALIGAQRASVSVAMAELRRARAAFGARGTYTIDPKRLLEFAGEAASFFGVDGAEPTAAVPAPAHAPGAYPFAAPHATTTRAA